MELADPIPKRLLGTVPIHDSITHTSVLVLALVELRISNHNLMIELGRYNQTTKDNRHCSFFGSSLIEGGVHFLFHCPKSLYDKE